MAQKVKSVEFGDSFKIPKQPQVDAMEPESKSDENSKSSQSIDSKKSVKSPGAFEIQKGATDAQILSQVQE